MVNELREGKLPPGVARKPKGSTDKRCSVCYTLHPDLQEHIRIAHPPDKRVPVVPQDAINRLRQKSPDFGWDERDQDLDGVQKTFRSLYEGKSINWSNKTMEQAEAHGLKPKEPKYPPKETVSEPHTAQSNDVNTNKASAGSNNSSAPRGEKTVKGPPLGTFRVRPGEAGRNYIAIPSSEVSIPRGTRDVKGKGRADRVESDEPISEEAYDSQATSIYSRASKGRVKRVMSSEYVQESDTDEQPDLNTRLSPRRRDARMEIARLIDEEPSTQRRPNANSFDGPESPVPVHDGNFGNNMKESTSRVRPIDLTIETPSPKRKRRNGNEDSEYCPKTRHAVPSSSTGSAPSTPSTTSPSGSYPRDSQGRLLTKTGQPRAARGELARKMPGHDNSKGGSADINAWFYTFYVVPDDVHGTEPFQILSHRSKPWELFANELRRASKEVAARFIPGRQGGFGEEDGAWMYTFIESGGSRRADGSRIWSPLGGHTVLYAEMQSAVIGDPDKFGIIVTHELQLEEARRSGRIEFYDAWANNPKLFAEDFGL